LTHSAVANRPQVSVVIPVFQQASFLPRALASLAAQRDADWELVVVDDGSTDDPLREVASMATSRPVKAVRWTTNRGLGTACNTALDLATGELIAYLPADDVWFDGHLADLVSLMDAQPDAALASAGVLVDDLAHADTPPGRGLQLVQVIHRRSALRWRERQDLESDDLGRLFFDAVRASGRWVRTGRTSCGWTQHPGQRSRSFARRHDGGINVFRRKYGASGPLRFAPRGEDELDERALYGDVSVPAIEPGAPHVLLVGELAYNPDRIALLAERGVRLSGLWIDDPLGFMTVGPLPFPGVRDLSRTNWIDEIRSDPPDVAYCLLNWRTVPLALALSELAPDLPLVWHFKEAPQRCLARGEWPSVRRLYERADGVLLASEEERDWFAAALPDRRDPSTTLAMDGDLPRMRWFTGPRADRGVSEGNGVHTVCVGRPVGLEPELVATLANAGIHLHLYGAPLGAENGLQRWLGSVPAEVLDHVHVHASVAPQSWRSELSRYDAGWLHVRPATNHGDVRRASWDDLNLPARLPTFAAAGLPVLLPDAAEEINAVHRTVRSVGADLSFTDDDAAVAVLHDAGRLRAARDAMEGARLQFTFDAVVDRLLAVLLHAAEGRAR
jgi:hypothetical protein